MPKHSGCFICGSTDDEILVSIPVLAAGDAFSAALCRNCYTLPVAEIKRKIETVVEAQKELRKKMRIGA
jgi:hypothetical protein